MSASDKSAFRGNPFADLTRKGSLQARLHRWARATAKPFRPDRINPKRPGPANLLLLGIDTLRADHLGLGGYPLPTSPNLDRLADRGTVFGDVTAPAPWTLPSFSSALCGVMPGVHGAFLPGPIRNMDTQPPRRLDDDAVSLAQHLRQQGYRTAAFYSNQFFAFGLAESFDQHHYFNLPAGDLLELAMGWIRRHADQPFFCFVLLNDPHEPTTPPNRDLAPFLPENIPTARELRAYARWGKEPGLHLGRSADFPAGDVARARELKLAMYDATIRYVDSCIGDFTGKLATLGLEKNTLVSVFSDHGEEFLDHVEYSREWNHDPRGLHGIGHGHSLFQELLRVPWISWGPGVPAGVRSREPVSLCDLAPTLCHWLKVAPLKPELPATDFMNNLVGRNLAQPEKDSEPRLLLAEAIAYGPDLVALRRDRWKLIAHRDGRALALFDLLSGPEENIDLAAANPQVVNDLLEELKRWRQSGPGHGGGSQSGGSWGDLDDVVRRRLKDLGYSD